MNINHDAPVTVRRQIEVFSPPEMVWEWLSRVELWQEWHPEISGSRWLEGRGRNGLFKWRLRKVVGMTCRMESWQEMREVGFVANAWSSTVRQVFRMDGDFRRTRVTAEASVEGPGYGLGLLRSAVQSQLERTNELWLGALKTNIESERVRARVGEVTSPAGLPKRGVQAKGRQSQRFRRR